MATILLTYEFGSGLGHLNRLIAIGRRLEAGNALVFALPNIEAATAIVTRAFGQRASLRSGIEWRVVADPVAQQAPTHTFADVIRLFGFDSTAILGAAVKRWRALIDDVRPDIVVADFAPTLRLAVGDDVPIVVVGNGYTVPPPGRVLPPMRPWQADVPPASRAREGRLLDISNRVRAENGGAAVDHVADLFSSRNTYVCTLPEFDPYAPHRTQPLSWPFNVPTASPGPLASERTGPDVFAYLPASHPSLDATLTALNSLGRRTHLFVTGMDPRALASRCSRHIGVLKTPADFAELLPQVKLLIHHAGLGTAYSGLMAGTPQLVLPVNLEHLITGRGLIAAGVAQGFNKPPPDAATLGGAVKAMLEDSSWVERAISFAAKLVLARDPDPLATVAIACEGLLAGLARR